MRMMIMYMRNCGTIYTEYMNFKKGDFVQFKEGIDITVYIVKELGNDWDVYLDWEDRDREITCLKKARKLELKLYNI